MRLNAKHHAKPTGLNQNWTDHNQNAKQKHIYFMTMNGATL